MWKEINIIIIILIQIILIKLNNSCSEDPQCYYGSKYVFDSRSSSDGPLSFEEAELLCQTKYGTHLASLETLADITDAKLACKLRSKGKDKCWIGLNDENRSPGDWIYNNGHLYNSTISDWAPGEPSSLKNPYLSNEHCVYISPEKEYKWNDFDCRGYSPVSSNIKVYGYLCNNPNYNPDLECYCNCDVCKVEGDPHITTFDGLLYHFMGECTYLYVTPCFNNYNELPIQISGSHVQCFTNRNDRTCLKEVYVNLYDSNGQIAAQLRLGENFLAQWTGVGNLHWSGNVVLNDYLNWNINYSNQDNKIRQIYIMRSNTNVLDVRFYWYDVTKHEVMDSRIQIAKNFDPNGWGAFVDIWLAECYAKNKDVCGLCGLYDFNALNDFHYIDENKQLAYISTADVSVVKTITLDAWRRTNIFGEHWINENLTQTIDKDNINCTVIGSPPDTVCAGRVETLCAQFWRQECDCNGNILYYNVTWLQGCIWDTCSLCGNLSWPNVNYKQALDLGCFAFANITCINNCRNETTNTLSPTYQPTLRPTVRPTPKPTNRPTTLAPTAPPSKPNPVLEVTPEPTERPTLSPSYRPTYRPTNRPTNRPTTKQPTENEQYWWKWRNTKKPTKQ